MFLISFIDVDDDNTVRPASCQFWIISLDVYLLGRGNMSSLFSDLMVVWPVDWVYAVFSIENAVVDVEMIVISVE